MYIAKLLYTQTAAITKGVMWVLGKQLKGG